MSDEIPEMGVCVRCDKNPAAKGYWCAECLRREADETALYYEAYDESYEAYLNDDGYDDDDDDDLVFGDYEGYDGWQQTPRTPAQQLADRLQLWSSRLCHKIRYIGRDDPWDDIPF